VAWRHAEEGRKMKAKKPLKGDMSLSQRISEKAEKPVVHVRGRRRNSYVA
jgi:hypothetical protein